MGAELAGYRGLRMKLRAAFCQKWTHGLRTAKQTLAGLSCLAYWCCYTDSQNSKRLKTMCLRQKIRRQQYQLLYGPLYLYKNC
jgi:hypothetical protein